MLSNDPGIRPLDPQWEILQHLAHPIFLRMAALDQEQFISQISKKYGYFWSISLVPECTLGLGILEGLVVGGSTDSRSQEQPGESRSAKAQTAHLTWGSLLPIKPNERVCRAHLHTQYHPTEALESSMNNSRRTDTNKKR